MTDQNDLASSSNASDLTLIRRLREGEGDAASDLYLRYADRLHRLARKQTSAELARRVEPEEIVQSVFRTFFRRVNEGVYNVPEGKELWGLFLVIALNKIRHAAVYHRAARRDVRKTTSADELAANSYILQDKAADSTALTVLQLVIEEITSKLPEVKREMIRLRIEGHEIEDIAQQTGRSSRSVERTLQEFRQALATKLHDGDEPRENPAGASEEG
jgi:RNA polymerase sigma-70 factor (ECF subfamily)